MSGLQGLRALQSQTTYAVPEENILERSGAPGVPDEAHGEAPYQGLNPNLAGPYPSQGNQNLGPSGLEDAYTGNWSLGQGSYDPDQSPISHAAPFPSPGYGEVRDGDAEWQMQQAGMDAHAADFGTPAIVATNPNGLDYQHANWNQWYAESPGTTVMEDMKVPGAIVSGAGGGRDRNVLGNGGNPTFDVAHIQHREQIDGVPYNKQWLDSTQRPFTVKNAAAVKATFDGPDSPYGWAGDETVQPSLSADQAAVMSDPSPYQAPADPTVAPAATSTNDSWAW